MYQKKMQTDKHDECMELVSFFFLFLFLFILFFVLLCFAAIPIPVQVESLAMYDTNTTLCLNSQYLKGLAAVPSCLSMPIGLVGITPFGVAVDVKVQSH